MKKCRPVVYNRLTRCSTTKRDNKNPFIKLKNIDFNKNIKDVYNSNLFRVSVYSWARYMHTTYKPRDFRYVILNIHNADKRGKIRIRKFDRFGEDGIGIMVNETTNNILNIKNNIMVPPDFKHTLDRFIFNPSIDKILIPCTYYYYNYGEKGPNGVVNTSSHFFCIVLIKESPKVLNFTIFEPYAHLQEYIKLNLKFGLKFINKFLGDLKNYNIKHNFNKRVYIPSSEYMFNDCKSPSIQIRVPCGNTYIDNKNLFNELGLNVNKCKFRDNGYCEIITKVFLNQVIEHDYYDFYNDYMSDKKMVLKYLLNYDYQLNNIIIKRYTKHIKTFLKYSHNDKQKNIIKTLL